MSRWSRRTPLRGRPAAQSILGQRGLQRLGKKAWRHAVGEMVPILMHAFLADYVVLGGGNARHLKQLPLAHRLGHNQTAFWGGFRLWTLEDVQTLAGDDEHHIPPLRALEWRLI